MDDVMSVLQGARVEGVIAVEGEPRSDGSTWSREAVLASTGRMGNMIVTAREREDGRVEAVMSIKLHPDVVVRVGKDPAALDPLVSQVAAEGYLLIDATGRAIPGHQELHPERHAVVLNLGGGIPREEIDTFVEDFRKMADALPIRSANAPELVRVPPMSADRPFSLSGHFQPVITNSRPFPARGELREEKLKDVPPHKLPGRWESHPHEWTAPFSDEQLRMLQPENSITDQRVSVVAVCPLVERGPWMVMALPCSIEGWAGEGEPDEVWLVKFGTMTVRELEELDEFEGW